MADRTHTLHRHRQRTKSGTPVAAARPPGLRSCAATAACPRHITQKQDRPRRRASQIHKRQRPASPSLARSFRHPAPGEGRSSLRRGWSPCRQIATIQRRTQQLAKRNVGKLSAPDHCVSPASIFCPAAQTAVGKRQTDPQTAEPERAPHTLRHLPSGTDAKGRSQIGKWKLRAFPTGNGIGLFLAPCPAVFCLVPALAAAGNHSRYPSTANPQIRSGNSRSASQRFHFVAGFCWSFHHFIAEHPFCTASACESRTLWVAYKCLCVVHENSFSMSSRSS